MAESQRFANLIQGELNQTLQLRDRGVKQAPFRVLMGATMPAVLVELGFISNPDEEKKLQDAAYRGQLVDALTLAVGPLQGPGREHAGAHDTRQPAGRGGPAAFPAPPQTPAAPSGPPPAKPPSPPKVGRAR